MRSPAAEPCFGSMKPCRIDHRSGNKCEAEHCAPQKNVRNRHDGPRISFPLSIAWQSRTALIVVNRRRQPPHCSLIRINANRLIGVH